MEEINLDEFSKEYMMAEVGNSIYNLFKFIYLRLLPYRVRSY